MHNVGHVVECKFFRNHLSGLHDSTCYITEAFQVELSHEGKPSGGPRFHSGGDPGQDLDDPSPVRERERSDPNWTVRTKLNNHNRTIVGTVQLQP